MSDVIDDLLDYVLADAYADGDQLRAFQHAFEELVPLPFPGHVGGAAVEVVAVDVDGEDRPGLLARCRQGDDTYRVALTEVVPGPVPDRTRQLVAAYLRWLGVVPLTAPDPTREGDAWRYLPLVPAWRGSTVVLVLRHAGRWDPEEEYWGEPEDALDPLLERVVAAGPRPRFEMEQVIPGVEGSDLADPIVEAADLHRVGRHRRAVRLLEGVLDRDERCVDAWAHLGLVAFDTEGPKAARALYETGVAIGERSLPDGFGGVLPGALIDNRPFLRCLHGFGLCAWRQRRWGDAAAVFATEVWLDPGGSPGPLACLHEVEARRRWRVT